MPCKANLPQCLRHHRFKMRTSCYPFIHGRRWHSPSHLDSDRGPFSSTATAISLPFRSFRMIEWMPMWESVVHA